MDANLSHAETNVDNTLLDTVRDRLEDARVADSEGDITSKHFHEVDNAISEALGQLDLFGQSGEAESQAGQLQWTTPSDRIPAEEDLASVHHQAIKDFQAIVTGHTGPLEDLMLQPIKYAQLTSVFPDLGDADIRQILSSARTARETTWEDSKKKGKGRPSPPSASLPAKFEKRELGLWSKVDDGKGGRIWFNEKTKETQHARPDCLRKYR